MGIRIIAEAYALLPITLMSIDFKLQHVGVWARTSVDGECGTRSNLDSESAARSRVDSEDKRGLVAAGLMTVCGCVDS